MAEERSGAALGIHADERSGSGPGGSPLDGWVHEIHDGDDVAALDAPPEDRFGDAVLAHHEQLARFAFLLSGSQETAEDAVAETYARLWPKFRRGRIQNVLPYLVREMILELTERPLRPGGSNPSTAETRDAAGADKLETPWTALQHLPLEQRSALVLHIVEGIGLEESALLLGDPVDVTASRIDEGLERIATLLVGGGLDA